VGLRFKCGSDRPAWRGEVGRSESNCSFLRDSYSQIQHDDDDDDDDDHDDDTNDNVHGVVIMANHSPGSFDEYRTVLSSCRPYTN